MSLPEPKKKNAPATPTMLDRNREQEEAAAREEGMRLDAQQDAPVGRLSVAPIRQQTLDNFEDQFTKLKRQRRSLKRYDVVEALLKAFAENEAVQAEVIKHLK